VRVSLDRIEETGDSLRNSRGEYKKAAKALIFLKNIKAHVQAALIYDPSGDMKTLDEYLEFAQQHMIQVSVNMLGKSINDQSKWLQQDLFETQLPAGLQGFLQYMAGINQKYRGIIANPEPLLKIIRSGGLNYFGCRAMDSAIAIKHDGSICMPCTGLKMKEQKGAIKQVYYGVEAENIRAFQGRYPACRGCYIKCMSMASGLLQLRGLVPIGYSYVRTIL